MGTHFWKPGDHVLHRGVGFSRLWWAMPATVVQDAPERIALYWVAGTQWKAVRQHATSRDLLTTKKVDLVDRVWTGTDVLMLKNPQEAHSVWLMREAGQIRPICWYVNLETAARRTPLGWDVMDYELDIVIHPDFSGWEWKDEDAFKGLCRAGVFSKEEAQAIRQEGERVIRKMQAKESPFGDGWEKWIPSLEWTIPVLPPDWAALFG